MIYAIEEEADEKVQTMSKSKKVAKEHKEQLQRLQEKDPEFYQFLQEHDKELLEFDDEDINDDLLDTDIDDAAAQVGDEITNHDLPGKEQSSKNITAAMVDSWIKSIREDGKLSGIRSMLKAFRTACHYGDDSGDDSSLKFSIMSSSVFNKIMLFVLSDMDGILRRLLKLPTSGGKKETILDLMNTRAWKDYNHLVKSYLGNSLHILNQMTDAEMISFSLRRLKYSSVFLAAFPSLLRKYIKEAFRKVYEWKFINCLELWTGAICSYSSESDLRPLAYPLVQIISGVARLVPTARYFPLRLRCVRMLNQISASTGAFIPVSMLLLDMLEMKELNRPPTGGIGKAVDLRTALKVSKPTLKTRAFQEACVYSVVEELAEHLAQWSYTVSFFELSFIPAVRLRSFCKSTKVDRFRKEMRKLIRQIESNSQYVNERRASITFLPNDPAAASFLEDLKKLGSSPLSQYVICLRQRAEQRNDSLMESNVLVGENSSIFGKKIAGSDDDEDDRANDEGAAVFSSSWLPGTSSETKPLKEKKKKTKKRKTEQKEKESVDEDVVEDLVLSSDEEAPTSDSEVHSTSDDNDANPVTPNKQHKKRKPSKFQKNIQPRMEKPKKRKRVKS